MPMEKRLLVGLVAGFMFCAAIIVVKALLVAAVSLPFN